MEYRGQSHRSTSIRILMELIARLHKQFKPIYRIPIRRKLNPGLISCSPDLPIRPRLLVAGYPIMFTLLQAPPPHAIFPVVVMTLAYPLHALRVHIRDLHLVTLAMLILIPITMLGDCSQSSRRL